MSNINLNNFKIVQISSLDIKDTKDICFLCIISTYRVATFSDCKHFCCTSCLDNLYDNYKDESDESDESDEKELFICPICNEKVYDIIYT